MAAKLARERATYELINNLLPLVKFAENLHPSVVCFLCKNILKDPMQISCGHRLCKTCNDTSIPTIDGVKMCPVHDEVIERAFPDRAALTDVMNLLTYCLAKEDECSWTGPLMDLEIHLKECEFYVKLKCPYSEFQCTYSGSVSNLETHLHEDSLKHDCLIATTLKELMERFNENNNTITKTKRKTFEIGQNFDNTNQELELLQDSLKETSALIDSHNDDALTVSLRNKSHALDDLITQSAGKKEKFVRFHNKFKELVKNVDRQMQRINGLNDTGTSSSKNKINHLEETNKAHEKQINELGVKIRIYQCSSNDGFYTWKLDNFTKRMEEAKSGQVVELYTPPLYTSTFGYKYSAKVMLNGDKSKGASNHIAFYIVIMQGDFDEILSFPFPYPIRITLMNSNRKNNITNNLYPDPHMEHFQKPFKSMNSAIGFAKFIPHEKLFRGGYIDADAIYFQISVEKTGVKVKVPNI